MSPLDNPLATFGAEDVNHYFLGLFYLFLDHVRRQFLRVVIKFEFHFHGARSMIPIVSVGKHRLTAGIYLAILDGLVRHVFHHFENR